MDSAATADTDADASRVDSARVVERFWELMRANDFLADGGMAVTDTVITDGVVKARAISFFTVTGGAIVRLREYWPDDYEAPGNRAHLVERLR